MISATGHEESEFAKDAIKFCRSHGIKVAVATAQPAATFFNPIQRTFLRGLGIKKTDVQLCPGKDARHDVNRSVKGPMIKEILRATGIPAKKALFFDDQKGNILTADSVGVNGHQCNKTYEGLTSSEFFDGLAELKSKPELIIFDIDYTLTRPHSEEEYMSITPEFKTEVVPYLMGSIGAYLVVVFVMRCAESKENDGFQ